MLSSSFEETLQICSYNSSYEVCQSGCPSYLILSELRCGFIITFMLKQVKPERVNLIIGSGGKKVKSIIEETGVDSIEAQDNGIVKITSKDLSSLEKAIAIISNLTMVPSVGDIYRNCEVKSIAPYGVFVEISPGREGLCHISELSSSWLAKAEDAVKVGDTIDVKLIEINGKGQLRLSWRALLADSITENSGKKQLTVDLSEENIEKSKRKRVTKAVEVENAELSDEISVDIKVTTSSKSKPVEANTLMEDKFVKKLVSSAKDALESERSRPKKSSNKPVISVSSKNETAVVNGEAKSG